MTKAPIESTHTRHEMSVDKLKTMLLVPDNIEAHLVDGRLPLTINYHGSITWKDGKPNVTAPAFFNKTEEFLHGQQVTGALAFPYGSGAFAGTRLDTYAPALAQTMAERFGAALKFDLSGHSQGGIVLGNQSMSQPFTRALIEQHRCDLRFLDPVMDKTFADNVEWAIKLGCGVGIVWGHSRRLPQKPIAERLAAFLRARFGDACDAAPYAQIELDIAVPDHGIILLKMNDDTPWRSHREIKGALPWLIQRTRGGGGGGARV